MTHWTGLTVRIDGNKFLDAATADDVGDKGIKKRKELKISPGQHEISVYSMEFPKTTVEAVEVYQILARGKSYHTRTVERKPANASGKAVLTLDERLWKKGSKFRDLGLQINISGNCEVPKTEPSEFGIVTVKFVAGKAEVEQPLKEFEKNMGMKAVSEAKTGASYRHGTTFMTGTDGLIKLESEYKHTITIRKNTSVTLWHLMTDSGHGKLRALMMETGGRLPLSAQAVMRTMTLSKQVSNPKQPQ